MPREPKTAIRLRKLAAWLAEEHGIRADIEHRQEGGRWQWWLFWYDGPAELPHIGGKAEELGIDIRNLMASRVTTARPPVAGHTTGSEASGSQRPPSADRSHAPGTGRDVPHAGMTATADPLTDATETLARLISAARDGLDTAAALASLSTARRLATELERSELVFIEAARDSGATWAQIAAAMGAAGRQTAQKRHTDLTRRFQRPPNVDMHP